MDYIEGNKQAWEEAFENRDASWGADIVKRIETEKYPFFNSDMISVLTRYSWANKTLGHFCSNNGRELLSLMQSGAREGIGFDIAENQVRFANEKAKVLKSNCHFVAGNILEIGSEFNNRFDLILITAGSLGWFKDLIPFFEKVAEVLKKEGSLIINEMHPVTNMLSAPGEPGYSKKTPANILNSYFEKEWVEKDGIFYITKKKYESKTFSSYSHSLSKILGTIIKTGIHITGFEEYDYDISGLFEELDNKGIPLSFILEGKKG